MSRSSLLWLMCLIETGAGLALLLAPEAARSALLGGALPGLAGAGFRVAGLALLGLGLLCLRGWHRGGLHPAFAIMLAYNSLAAAGLAVAGLLAGPGGPLLWPAVLLHAVLVGLQVRALRRP